MNTTISIPVELRQKLKSLGMKGDTYADVIERLYEAGREHYLEKLLMDIKGTIPIEEALKEAKGKQGAGARNNDRS